MIFAELNLSLEPAWPWSLPHIGGPSIITTAIVLTLLTVWTYVGVKSATRLRVGALVLLRLVALTLTFLVMLRPSLGVTHPEGVEQSKWLVVWDASESMNVADGSAQSTRWAQVAKLWESRAVQRRLAQLKDEQKIEVVKYLADEELRPDAPGARADGKRTDIGVWLHQLWQKHGHEKHLRGIAIFSDGADNGTKFSAQEKARQWRGVCRIDAFGVGNPNDPKLGKDIALTQLRVEPAPIPVKSKMTIKAVAQAPGFEKTEVAVSVWLESTAKNAPFNPEGTKGDGKIFIKQAKDQPIVITCAAPEKAGEYKLTVKIALQPDETNKDNNEISTFVQVVNESINVLWVDRPRVYEPTFALRYALAPEKRFQVRYVEPPPAGKDPLAWYEMDKNYDVIVIGDVSAQQFSAGNPKIFDAIKEMVTKKTGLLMLGGTEAFAAGGWDKHKPLMELLPVTFDKAGMSEVDVRAVPTPEGLQHAFIRIIADPDKNKDLWEKQFDELNGLAEMGSLTPGDVALLRGNNDQLVMALGKRGGNVVVFGGDSTSRAWRGNQDAVDGYQRFWKQLVLSLAQQQDGANQLWINLDKRRLSAGTGDVLGFTFGLRGKSGELPKAQFKAKIAGPNQKEYPVSFVFDAQHQHQRGSFRGAKEPGEYKLVITGTAKELNVIEAEGEARFLVEASDMELARPAADHEALSKIAAAAEGRFHLAEEPLLLQLLDEMRSQVNSESRMKTTHWPDWKRLPASEHARDQFAGLWNSFALGSFLLFTLLIGCEWLLRRMWGLV